MKPSATLFLFIMCHFAVPAQNFQLQLVTDLNPFSGSNPRWFTTYHDTLYYFASDGTTGHKIFRMAGGGLPALCPNVTGNAVFGDGAISTNYRMGILKDKLYLPIAGPGVGRELFTYDGINTPTMVLDINPGNAGSAPYFFTVLDHKLYFHANSPATGTELWVHDSATNTTQCISDINPGPLSSGISLITIFNNKLYFAGTNGNDTTAGNTGSELYCYDPALAQVSLVADINPGYLPSNPTAFMVANNKLYFAAQEPVYGKELYEYDGVNVTRLTDVNPGPAQGVYTSDHSFPTYFNNSIYFAANDAANLINLGRYDLQTNTASILYCSGPNSSGIPRYFKVWDSLLIFSNQSDTTGLEPWKCDGVNPPQQIWDVYPGQNGSNPMFYTIFDSCLYFNASNDTSTGEELFRLVKEKIVVEPNGMDETGFKLLGLSPNPVRDLLHLHYQTALNDVRIRISDLAGRVVMDIPPAGPGAVQNTLLDVSSLNPGMYRVSVFSGDGSKKQLIHLVKE